MTFDVRGFLRDRRTPLKEKMARLHQLIEEARPKGEYLHFRTVTSPAGPRVTARDLGGPGEAEKIMMASNNYLGLTKHPHVMERARAALDEWGVGAGGPNTIQGWSTPAQALEADLAEFKGCEAAILSPSGYSANVGAVTALVGPGDAFVTDELDHASIVDAGRFSGADFYTFRHRDPDDLRRVLEELRGHRGTKLVVTCGVFSMSGHVPPLGDYVELTREHDAMLMVDDAHGTGVLGPTGRGSTEHCGVTGAVDIVMGTFSKAFGCYGGFVAGSAPLVTYLRHFARATMFSAALSPMVIGAVHGALEVMRDDPEPLRQVTENAAWMKATLADVGFDVGESLTPIIPVMIRDEGKCLHLVRAAYEAGLFLSMVQYPAVPKGTERIRLTVAADHTTQDLEQAAAILVRLGREQGLV